MAEKKVVSIEDRIPKLKQARKKKANRRLIFYLSLFFILIGMVVYLQSPLSHVHEVEVSGNIYIDKEKISSLTELSSNDNFWGVKTTRVKEKVMNHPEIKSVAVSKKFPSTIKIVVEEYNRVGYVKNGSEYFALLENGDSLTSSPLHSIPGDAPLLLNFSKQTYLQEMTKELSRLPNSIVNLISEIHWQPTDGNPYKIWMFMNDGFEVDGSIRNFSSAMKSYPSISAQLDPEIKGVIHMANGGAVFNPYKTPQNEENQDEVEG